jgi:hypothetical protein
MLTKSPPRWTMFEPFAWWGRGGLWSDVSNGHNPSSFNGFRSRRPVAQSTVRPTPVVVPSPALKASVNKAAYGYTHKHVGPRERVGNKGGTLRNRLRAVMGEKK